MRVPVYLLVIFLCACGGGGDDASPPADSTGDPEPSGDETTDTPVGGYFWSETYALFDDYYRTAEAIVTPDGQIRIHYSDDGTGAFSFLGAIDMADTVVWSPGLLIGETCGQPNRRWGCDGVIPAEVQVSTLTGDTMKGVIRWQKVGEAGFSFAGFDLTSPTSTYMDVPASSRDAQGTFREEHADFARDGDVVTTIDAAGNLFFQSPGTGCTGNGSLAPFGDGSVNAYSVVLVIENCGAGFEYLNGSLEGLATHSVGDASWGDWMVFWLSSSGSAATDVALTMRARRM